MRMADVTKTIRDIFELTGPAQEACKIFLEECRKKGYDIFITETYRPQERQDYLYSIGRTRPGNKVTWTRNSRHTSRRAWDIACRGAKLYDEAILKKCGDVAAKLGIIWGGNWSTPDTPHFEVNTVWTRPQTVPMRTAVDAIFTLNQRGIINMPDIWYDGTFSKDHVRQLLRKLGETEDVGTAIWNLHLKGIIVEYPKWYDGAWSKEDVYWLIRKYCYWLENH